MAVPRLRFKGFEGNWDSRKFSDTLSFLGTNSFSRDKMNNMSGSVKNVHYGDILVRYGNVLDVLGEQIPFINEDVSTCKIKEKDYLLSGDVIIADTAEDYTVGKATEIINTQGIKIVAGLHTQACRPKRKFAIGYIGNFINSLAFRHQLRRIAQGTKVLSIIKTHLTDMEIHFPVEKEQQKIADFLTTFDKRIAAQQNIIADLEETKKGLLQKIFNQEIRFKDDNGQDYPDWKDKRLGAICQIFKGAPLSKSDISAEGKPFILYGELYTTYSEVTYDVVRKTRTSVDERYYSEVGDVLVPTSGESAEEISTATCVMQKGVILAGDLNVVRSNVIDGRILSYMLNHTKKHDLSRVAQGISVVHSKAEDLKKLIISIPAVEEQQKIAAFLSAFDKKITAEKQIISDLKEIKKGLLQQMFV